MPVPQTINFPVRWAGDPALERLINHGARSHIQPGSIVGCKIQSTVNTQQSRTVQPELIEFICVNLC